jgi:hypothetical protein
MELCLVLESLGIDAAVPGRIKKGIDREGHVPMYGGPTAKQIAESIHTVQAPLYYLSILYKSICCATQGSDASKELARVDVVHFTTVDSTAHILLPKPS